MNRYLLIHAWGNGFWSDVMHVAGQLMLAEVTGRIPIVFWSSDSFYASDERERDAFTMYFLPVSQYSVYNLVHTNLACYPLYWNTGNLLQPNYKEFHDTDVILSRSEPILVSNSFMDIGQLITKVNADHPAYGFDTDQLYRYIYKKYLQLQPALQAEIDGFYMEKMMDRKPVIGVHVRGSDKKLECPNLDEINNKLCPQQIDHLLNLLPHASIYFMTDSEMIFSKYKGLYGDKVISADIVRTHDENIAAHYISGYNKRQKGIDIVKDTYLAMKCDYFIGNRYSNVSTSISLIRDWPQGTLMLIQ